MRVVHSDGDVEVLFPTVRRSTFASWTPPSLSRSFSGTHTHLRLHSLVRVSLQMMGPKTFTFGADRLAPYVAGANDGWIDSADAAAMAKAPKLKRDAEGEGEGEEDGDGDGAGSSSRSRPRVPLVRVADSRGDLPLHLLARAYVAKSREPSRLKNATLAQFSAVLASLLAAPSSEDWVNAKGHDGRSALLILSRAEAEPANLELVLSASARLLAVGASVHAATSGGHTALHLAADVGNHALCAALVARGADPNAQSADGMTPYGYACQRLAAHASGHASGHASAAGGRSSSAAGSSDLAATRMLQRTADVLLELGAYRVERSALAIEQDSVTALWMKVKANWL